MTDSDQDRVYLKKLGLTRTKYVRKISDRDQNLYEILDQLGLGPVDITVSVCVSLFRTKKQINPKNCRSESLVFLKIMKILRFFGWP